VPAQRALRRLLDALPAPAQRLGTTALRLAALRWPLLARLLGMSDAAPTQAPQPESVAPAVPSPARRDELVARLRASNDYAERARAALALGAVKEPQATAALVEALRDRSTEVASQAAESLARHAGDRARDALVAVLENRDGYFGPATRASAVRALGTILPAEHGSAIATAVSDVDALVSLAAIATLAERDEILSAGALMNVLEDSRDFYLPLTRQAAARALLRLHNYDRDRLRELIARESDATVREALSSLAN
jgi:HEAT repeat protein